MGEETEVRKVIHVLANIKKISVNHDALYLVKLREATERFTDAMSREDTYGCILHARTIAALSVLYLETNEDTE